MLFYLPCHVDISRTKENSAGGGGSRIFGGVLLWLQACIFLFLTRSLLFQVIWTEQQIVKRRVHRDYNPHYNDPDYDKQWFLVSGTIFTIFVWLILSHNAGHNWLKSSFNTHFAPPHRSPAMLQNTFFIWHMHV